MGDVGFVGVGKMGSRMANRLLDAGHNLTVWNSTGHVLRRERWPFGEEGRESRGES